MKITGHYEFEAGSRHEKLDINIDFSIDELKDVLIQDLRIHLNDNDLKLFKQVANRLGSILDNRATPL